jgi:hypothetical protein
MVSLPSEKKPSRLDFKFLLGAGGAYVSKKNVRGDTIVARSCSHHANILGRESW